MTRTEAERRMDRDKMALALLVVCGGCAQLDRLIGDELDALAVFPTSPALQAVVEGLIGGRDELRRQMVKLTHEASVVQQLEGETRP